MFSISKINKQTPHLLRFVLHAMLGIALDDALGLRSQHSDGLLEDGGRLPDGRH